MVLKVYLARFLSVKFVLPPQCDRVEWNFIQMPTMNHNIQVCVRMGTFVESLSPHFLLSLLSGVY